MRLLLLSLSLVSPCDTLVHTERRHGVENRQGAIKSGSGIWSKVDLLGNYSHGRRRPRWAGQADPLLGTGGHGHTFPGPTVPWGMVQVTPWVHSSQLDPWDTVSGYHHDAPEARFYGMAHTALSGAGTGEMGELRLLPMGKSRNARMLLHSPSVEAQVGSFSCEVYPVMTGRAAGKILIESTAAVRGAVHRFTFPSTGERWLEVSLLEAPGSYWGLKVVDADLRAASDRQLEGCSSGKITGMGDAATVLCFVMEFDQPFRLGDSKGSDESARERVKGSVDLLFSEGSRPLSAAVGVSRTDVAHAAEALREVRGRALEEVVASARASWEEALGVVQADFVSEAEGRMFYTALYHSMISPNVLSDGDGTYRLQDTHSSRAGKPNRGWGVPLSDLDMDLPRHQTRPNATMYHTFSFWDTYRLLHPLMNLLQPAKSRDFGESLLSMLEYWGHLPPWQLVQSQADIMTGDGGGIVLATMARLGLVDKDRAFEALDKARKAPVDERRYLNEFKLEAAGVEQHVSRFLEQAKADHCVGELARDLGRAEAAGYYERRADLFFSLWNKDRELFAPLPSSVAGLSPGAQRAFEDLAYTEGTAYQYSWGADFNLPKLMKMRGGRERFACKLDAFFKGKKQTGPKAKDMTGSFGAASLGNEPTQHTPLLFSRAGYPSRTQEVVDRMVREVFSEKVDGLPGNDDLGATSALLAASMLGLYPMECSDEWVVGRPFVKSANITLLGNLLQVVVNGQSRENKYVQRLQWQGKDVDIAKPGLTSDGLSEGGRLEFWMASQPAGPQLVCE